MKGLVLATLLVGCTSGAAEYVVSEGGDDGNDGSSASPFRTVTRGLGAVQNGDRLTLRAGTYRLMEESPDTMVFSRPNATAADHVIIEGEPGAKVLGSLSTAQQSWTWVSGTVWRTGAEFLPRDPAGMFDGAERVEHVMVSRNGIRSHADVSALQNPNEWTKADDAGTGCDATNAGCFLYLRLGPGEDPNGRVYELSQRKLFHATDTSYLEVKHLSFAYMQDSAFTIEGGQGQVVEGNVFAHNSNSNDNAYAVFIGLASGVVVRGNEAFDSKYWGGFSNSKGITFITMDENVPSIVEDNYVHDIVGQCITTKNGVKNLIVRRNHLARCGIAVEPGGPRCDWQGCSVRYYPGGSWRISENLFEQNEIGVQGFALSETGEPSIDNVIFNNVFAGSGVAAVSQLTVTTGSVIANNLFVNNARAIYLNNGASGATMTWSDFDALYQSHHNGFFGNGADVFLRPDWAGAENSGAGRTLAEFVAAEPAREKGSLSADPLFVSAADFHLQEASPARGHGDGSFFSTSAAVDLGMYPFGGAAATDGGSSDVGADAGAAGGAGGGPAKSPARGCGCSGTGQLALAALAALAVLGGRRRRERSQA